jgi:hypothetical protein
MNTNTTKWAVEVGNERLSKAVQTIAFSFGYSWAGGVQLPQFVIDRYLKFDPEFKRIHSSDDRKSLETQVCKIVTSFDDVMKMFENPPKADLEIGDFTIAKDGTVMIYKGIGKTVITSDEFDKVVAERNKYLGKKGKLPVVRFVYTSQNSGRKMRNVIVTKMTTERITGLDMDDDNKLKEYLVSKVSGQVELLSFLEIEDS